MESFDTEASRIPECSGAVQHDPWKPEDYLHLGIALLQTGKNSEAVLAYKQGINAAQHGEGNSGNLSALYRNLGVTLQTMGRLEEGAGHTLKSFNLDNSPFTAATLNSIPPSDCPDYDRIIGTLKNSGLDAGIRDMFLQPTCTKSSSLESHKCIVKTNKSK